MKSDHLKIKTHLKSDLLYMSSLQSPQCKPSYFLIISAILSFQLIMTTNTCNPFCAQESVSKLCVRASYISV